MLLLPTLTRTKFRAARASAGPPWALQCRFLFFFTQTRNSLTLYLDFVKRIMSGDSKMPGVLVWATGRSRAATRLEMGKSVGIQVVYTVATRQIKRFVVSPPL
jgi:hypothetical protein